MASASKALIADKREGVVGTHVRLSEELNEHLRVHAVSLRNVSVNRLINDVLTLWVLSITNLKDPRFRRQWIGVSRPTFAPEPYEGYLASLCEDASAQEPVEEVV
jgi:hypothetical protein